MNDLQIFQNEQFGDVRIVVIENTPWFVGKDVALILGYKDTNNAIKLHCRGVVKHHPILDALGRNQEVRIIPESDLYRLILKSQLADAEKFERWVMEDVLPTIRKTGGAYLTAAKAEEILLNPDAIITLATQIKELHAENAAKQKQIEEYRPKARFADAVSDSHTSILVGELAKLLKQNGVAIGQNRLFEWLRQKSYLISRKGGDFNMPTQYAMELGLFEIKERAVENPDGTVRITKTPKVSGKGQIYFINKFLQEAAEVSP